MRARHLVSVVFVAAIAIACSKKAKQQEPSGEAPAPSASVVTQPPVTVTEPPPPPSATDTATPPAGSVVTTPTTVLPVTPPADPVPAPTPGRVSVSAKGGAKAEKAEKPLAKKKPPTEENRKDDALKSALEDGDLDASKVAPAKPAKPKPTTTPSTPPPAPPAATASADTKPKDRESQPSATPLKHSVSVTTASHYACTTKDHKESVSVSSETRGARITIGGQGPCPGEIREWIAEVGDKRVDVHGTHGAQSKCTCAGTGDMVLRGLEPGTYDVHVNGGFNRPIAVRVVVGSP